MGITYRPKRKKRKRVHGFLRRSKKGRNVLRRRREKKRSRLTV
ncbi:MAG: 50S ribosomal protein L34 [Candidatus Bathyarchaeota archaeon]|nr:50S ribosomal protein L34 [Candidatus Bathyarchaeota archaeon]